MSKIEWDDKKENVVMTMWHWGHSSSDIAKAINVESRNAIMGKINRLNLMGQKGIKVGAYFHGPVERDTEIDEVVSEYSGNEFDPANHEDQVTAVIIAAIRYGLHEENIHKATGLPMTVVKQIIQDLEETRCWPRNAKPPAQWWHHHEGNMALMLDVLVAMKAITFVEKKGERHYYMTEDQKKKGEKELHC